jgi:predicted MPP superfamily phosphohydrolase
VVESKLAEQFNKRQFVVSLVGCLLFVVTACYLYSSFDYDFDDLAARRSEEAIVNAALLFVALGVPGFGYALWAGFGWRGRPAPDGTYQGAAIFRRGLRLAVTAVGMGLVLWGFWIEPASLRVSEHRLPVATWPADCDGLRIAVLADLHIGSPYNDLAQLRKVVARTNAAAADLILLPGDFVIQGVIGGEFQSPEATAEILKELRAPAGVYAVLGNHDRILDAARVEAALWRQGIPVLEDRGVELNHGTAHGNCRLNLVGVSDFWEGPHDVAKALASVSAAVPTLLFTHNPDVFPQVPAEVAFTIAGHTHGGQVYLPGVGRPVVPSQYGQRYAVGHIQESGKHMYVSSGVGTSIIPVRFLVPPEITVLELYNPGANRD